MRQLLVKYLENRCNVYEIDQVLAYLKTKAGQQQLASLMDQEIYEDSVIHKSEANDADYSQLFKRIKSSVKDQPQKSIPKSIPLYKKWYTVAAVISGFVLIASVAWHILLSPATTTYQTTYGETKSIVLPDSSVVTLNANSSLLVQNDFDDQREVWLEGEAFFEVEKTRSENGEAYIKFIVHTDRLKVEVLGTSFNVQDWEEKTQVVLKSGKVKLKSIDNEELTMEPGELAEISSDSKAILKKVVNPEIYAAWTENKLLCQETPLSELAILMEHRYGKQVIFEDTKLKTLAVSGTLPLANLSTLIEILKESLKINITTHEGTLTVRE